jgi:hypothetical protein
LWREVAAEERATDQVAVLAVFLRHLQHFLLELHTQLL